MTENNNTTFCVGKSLSSRVQQFHKNLHKQMTFYEILENVEEQIQIDCFSGSDLENAKEIALIIAEVIKLPDSAKVRISGNDISAEMVSDVYDMLEHENVCEVIRRYKEATYEN